MISIEFLLSFLAYLFIVIIIFTALKPMEDILKIANKSYEEYSLIRDDALTLALYSNRGGFEGLAFYKATDNTEEYVLYRESKYKFEGVFRYDPRPTE